MLEKVYVVFEKRQPPDDPPEYVFVETENEAGEGRRTAPNPWSDHPSGGDLVRLGPFVADPQHDWDAQQVVEAVSMLRAFAEGNDELLPSTVRSWLADNHPGAEAHVAAVERAARGKL
jgi:hypothetical protein